MQDRRYHRAIENGWTADLSVAMEYPRAEAFSWNIVFRVISSLLESVMGSISKGSVVFTTLMEDLKNWCDDLASTLWGQSTDLKAFKLEK